jgi:prepilin-type N-terminal cleavage/methylation domain-containing protein
MKMFINRKGFTLIELLLVIVIMGIISSVIFVSVANQRSKAKINAAMQTAKGSFSVAKECYFRVGSIETPNDIKEPTNEICVGSKTKWMPITVSECDYLTAGDPGNYYEIICGSLGIKIRCSVDGGGVCEESAI